MTALRGSESPGAKPSLSPGGDDESVIVVTPSSESGGPVDPAQPATTAPDEVESSSEPVDPSEAVELDLFPLSEDSRLGPPPPAPVNRWLGTRSKPALLGGGFGLLSAVAVILFLIFGDGRGSSSLPVAIYAPIGILQSAVGDDIATDESPDADSEPGETSDAVPLSGDGQSTAEPAAEPAENDDAADSGDNQAGGDDGSDGEIPAEDLTDGSDDDAGDVEGDDSSTPTTESSDTTVSSAVSTTATPVPTTPSTTARSSTTTSSTAPPTSASTTTTTKPTTTTTTTTTTSTTTSTTTTTVARPAAPTGCEVQTTTAGVGTTGVEIHEPSEQFAPQYVLYDQNGAEVIRVSDPQQVEGDEIEFESEPIGYDPDIIYAAAAVVDGQVSPATTCVRRT